MCFKGGEDQLSLVVDKQQFNTCKQFNSQSESDGAIRELQ